MYDLLSMFTIDVIKYDVNKYISCYDILFVMVHLIFFDERISIEVYEKELLSYCINSAIRFSDCVFSILSSV